MTGQHKCAIDDCAKRPGNKENIESQARDGDVLKQCCSAGGIVSRVVQHAPGAC